MILGEDGTSTGRVKLDALVSNSNYFRKALIGRCRAFYNGYRHPPGSSGPSLHSHSPLSSFLLPSPLSSYPLPLLSFITLSSLLLPSYPLLLPSPLLLLTTPPLLIDMGLHVYGDYDSPIVPILMYNPAKIAAFSRECLARGIAVVVVGFPATSPLYPRARFCVSAGHTREDMDRALTIIDEVSTLLCMKYSKNIIGWA